MRVELGPGPRRGARFRFALWAVAGLGSCAFPEYSFVDADAGRADAAEHDGQRCSVPGDCASGICASGVCQPSCTAPMLDCDGIAENGCETNIRTDPAHCGACAGECKLANATADCVGAVCRIAACQPGFADCNGDPNDGCEVNVVADKSSCGVCGKICPSLNGAPYCENGACQITCDMGFGDCDNDRSNGCEKDTSRDAMNCGRCGQVCTPERGGTPWCKGGTCGESICPVGRGDCNADPDDGCETDLSSDPHNCQTCGTLCVVAHGTAACNKGVCAITSCTAPYADCARGYADGCETDTNNDATHCGNCDTACKVANGTPKCATGACQVKSCSAPFADCDGMAGTGCEVDVSKDQTNCGGCTTSGQNCDTAYAHATSHCQSSACALDACAAGFANCDGSEVNGCEKPIDADPMNCGGCNAVCKTTHASGGNSCSAGTCHPVCDPGYVACGDLHAGCTTQLGTSSNCTACGDACKGGTPLCGPNGCTDHLDIGVVSKGVTAQAGWNGSDLPAITLMHDLPLGKGAYRMVLVGVASQEQFHAPFSVQYNHVDMLSSTDAQLPMQVSSENQAWAGIYYLLDDALPASPGTYPVTVRFSSSPMWGNGIVDVVSFKNVHQTTPFIGASVVGQSLDCPQLNPRSVTIGVNQPGSFVYAIASARSGNVAVVTNDGPAQFQETLNVRVNVAQALMGMAGYVGPVSTSQTFSWDVASCWNTASVGVALRRMSAP